MRRNSFSTEIFFESLSNNYSNIYGILTVGFSKIAIAILLHNLSIHYMVALV